MNDCGVLFFCCHILPVNRLKFFVDLNFCELAIFFYLMEFFFACSVDDMFIFHHTCCGVVFAVILCLSE